MVTGTDVGRGPLRAGPPPHPPPVIGWRNSSRCCTRQGMQAGRADTRSVCDSGVMAAGSIGERIAAYRRRRGISQAALAGLVGRSESWLSQVERGVRSVDRLSVLLDMSRVLHVDVESLIGRPWDLAPNGNVENDELGDVRRFFARYDQLVGVADQPAPKANLRARIAIAHKRYQAAEYRGVVGDLPSLLAEVDSAHYEGGRADRQETLLAYVYAYVVGAKLLTKLGAPDLAMLAADRSAAASMEAGSLSARGLAAYQVACALLRADRTDDAEHLAVTMAAEVDRGARSDDPACVSVAGALWLIGAVIAARRTERSSAWERLTEPTASLSCSERTGITSGRRSVRRTLPFTECRSRRSLETPERHSARPRRSTPTTSPRG